MLLFDDAGENGLNAETPKLDHVSIQPRQSAAQGSPWSTSGHNDNNNNSDGDNNIEAREVRDRKLSRKAQEVLESQSHVEKIRKKASKAEVVKLNDKSNPNRSPVGHVEVENVADQDVAHCVCGKIGSGIMIDCDCCKGWFHTGCITYICEKCGKGEEGHAQMKNEEHKKLERLLKEKEKDEVLKKKYQEESDASEVIDKRPGKECCSQK